MTRQFPRRKPRLPPARHSDFLLAYLLLAFLIGELPNNVMKLVLQADLLPDVLFIIKLLAAPQTPRLQSPNRHSGGSVQPGLSAASRSRILFLRSGAADKRYSLILMTYSEFHWKIFNFMARRVIAVGFVGVGLVLAIFGVPNLLPGGTVLVNGIPSDDLVFRWVCVLLPLLVVALGIALFKAAPFVPPKK